MSALPKAWWKSRVVWFNVAVGISSGLALLETALRDYAQTMPAWLYLLLLVVVSSLNAGLRFATKQPLAKRPEPQQPSPTAS